MRAVDAWCESWLGAAPLARLALFRIWVAALAFAAFVPEAWTLHAEATAFAESPTAAAWRPIELFALASGAAPSPRAVLAVAWLGGAALVAACVGLRSRSSAFVGALAHVWITGAAYSFGRVHHDEVALTFALLSLPLAPCGAVLSLDAWRARRRGEQVAPRDATARGAAIPMRMTQVTIAIGYAAAGWSKLASGGLEWLDGWTLMSAFAEADRAVGGALGGDVLVCRSLSLAVIALQLAFPLALWFPRTAWILLPSAWCFHLVSWGALGTGSYATLWGLYVAFLPLERWRALRFASRGSEAPTLARRGAPRVGVHG